MSSLIIVGLIMGVYVLPQLLSVFKDSGVTDLPITTRILMTVTDFLNTYFYYIVTALGVVGVLLYRFLRTQEGKIWRDNLMVNLPGLGTVVRNLYLARVAESLSTLIKSGISILDAIQITPDLVANENYLLILLA